MKQASRQPALIGGLPANEVAAILNQMPSDDVAELLGEDVPERRGTLLTAMDADDASAVRTLLTYPQWCAGRIMTPHFVKVRQESYTANATVLKMLGLTILDTARSTAPRRTVPYDAAFSGRDVVIRRNTAATKAGPHPITAAGRNLDHLAYLRRESLFE